jgi:putative aminopeptidase FrvX
MDDFLTELRALLVKYDATIGWDCHPCSDMHGVTGEHMYAQIGSGPCITLADEGYIDRYNTGSEQ